MSETEVLFWASVIVFIPAMLGTTIGLLYVLRNDWELNRARKAVFAYGVIFSLCCLVIGIPTAVVYADEMTNQYFQAGMGFIIIGLLSGLQTFKHDPR